MKYILYSVIQLITATGAPASSQEHFAVANQQICQQIQASMVPNPTTTAQNSRTVVENLKLEGAYPFTRIQTVSCYAAGE